jgi:hypothetical protein
MVELEFKLRLTVCSKTPWSTYIFLNKSKAQTKQHEVICAENAGFQLAYTLPQPI